MRRLRGSLVRQVAGQTRLLAANSCLIPLPMVAGAEVYTVEALADSDRLAEVQQAMVGTGCLQPGHRHAGLRDEHVLRNNTGLDVAAPLAM